MKNILIIGFSRFGHHLCDFLKEQGDALMVVDKSEETVSDLIYSDINVQIGDCTDPGVVKSLGVSDFDLVFVCIGNSFQDSLEVTSLVKDAGAKCVISKANTNIHARLLKRVGADEVIHPDKDMAERIARKYSMDHVYDYIEIEDGYSIAEIIPMKEWIGRSIQEVNVREKYGINVISVKTSKGSTVVIPPTYTFREDEHLVVIGADKDVAKLVKKYK